MFGWATHAVARAARRGDAVRRPDAIVHHGPRTATCLRWTAPPPGDPPGRPYIPCR
jgi:hypothetical protein